MGRRENVFALGVGVGGMEKHGFVVCRLVFQSAVEAQEMPWCQS